MSAKPRNRRVTGAVRALKQCAARGRFGIKMLGARWLRVRSRWAQVQLSRSEAWLAGALAILLPCGLLYGMGVPWEEVSLRGAHLATPSERRVNWVWFGAVWSLAVMVIAKAGSSLISLGKSPQAFESRASDASVAARSRLERDMLDAELSAQSSKAARGGGVCKRGAGRSAQGRQELWS